MKEFVEACPIIDAVQRLVDASSSSSSGDAEPFTIVDLASGKGKYFFFESNGKFVSIRRV